MINCEHFLDMVCAQISLPSCRRRVRNELAAHLEDRIEYLVNERGLSNEEAVEKAIKAMGDPTVLAQALKHEHCLRRYYFPILLTVCIWSAIIRIIYLFLRYFSII